MSNELIAQARLLARMSDLPTKQMFERLADRIEELEGENEMLRQGDTCARLCEGTAYRIELRQAQAALAGIVRVLGPAAPDCDGCAAEIGEALRIARGAVFVTPNAAMSGAEPALSAERPLDGIVMQQEEK